MSLMLKISLAITSGLIVTVFYQNCGSGFESSSSSLSSEDLTVNDINGDPVKVSLIREFDKVLHEAASRVKESESSPGSSYRFDNNGSDSDLPLDPQSETLVLVQVSSGRCNDGSLSLKNQNPNFDFYAFEDGDGVCWLSLFYINDDQKEEVSHQSGMSLAIFKFKSREQIAHFLNITGLESGDQVYLIPIKSLSDFNGDNSEGDSNPKGDTIPKARYF